MLKSYQSFGNGSGDDREVRIGKIGEIPSKLPDARGNPPHGQRFAERSIIFRPIP